LRVLPRHRIRNRVTSKCGLLYLPRLQANMTCAQYVQRKISALLNECQEWATVALDGNQQVDDDRGKTEIEREQFLLRADYWSTKMLITRPCLCRIERRIQNESATSAVFNSKSAATCVEAALELTKLFPDQPDLYFLYIKGPWWAVIHPSKPTR
jgi:hypothetical protein